MVNFSFLFTFFGFYILESHIPFPNSLSSLAFVAEVIHPGLPVLVDVSLKIPLSLSWFQDKVKIPLCIPCIIFSEIFS